MEEVFQTQKGSVRLYACGGGGVNIGVEFEKFRNKSDKNFAMIEPVYIDTSKSNLRAGIPSEHCYMLDGLDGSGKVRAENYEEISSRIRDILQQYKPLDLNIVLSTGAGGSGSVIAPSLVGELLEREVPTVVIAIGSADTRLDTENTLKTLKSYESIARLKKAPVVLAYFENTEQSPRTEVDGMAKAVIMALCALFSRENKELDSRDLFNWLRFDRVTTFPVGLASLSLIENMKELVGRSLDLQKLGNVISVATIAKDVNNTRLPVMPEYHCVGFLDEEANDSLVNRSPLHFVITDGVFGEVATRLQGTLRQLDEAQKARIVKKALIDNNDRATDTGLVL